MAWSKGLKQLALLLLPPAFWLGVWQLGALWVDRWVGGRGNELLLPYPASVGAALLELAVTGDFWQSVLLSVGRILLGLALGVLLGSLLAPLTCLNLWWDRILSPAVRVIRATPVASFILLVLLWTGRDTVPVVIAALMVLPVVWGNLVHGIRATDPQLLELARAYRFSPLKTVHLIYLPSLTPHFVSALTTSMGLAWKSGVAAEVLSLPKFAMGSQIYHAKLAIEIPHLFAWTGAVIALSLGLEGLLGLLLKRQNRRAAP